MTQRSWGKGLSEIIFKKDVPTAEETRERYLKLARRCMENAERLSSRSASSSLQFNHGQCQYLANNLRKVLFEAETSSAWPRSSTIDVQGVEIMKLLWRCAKEVEGFVLGCCRNNWVQVAVVLANMAEFVCQLSADLEFCMLLIRNKSNGKGWGALDESENDVFLRSERIKEIVSEDQKALVTRLETVNPSSNSSEQETQLAQCLATRLSQHLSGSVELGCWEIQFSSLVPGQRLGSGSAGVIVRKSNWMGEEVAEKVFQGADNASFKNEVRILAGLAHPNIVPLIGYAEDGNRRAIVMELMDDDLSSLMEERLRHNPTLKVPFSDCEAVDMMLQTAEGVRYLHEKRVVHRDLKALNILVKCRKDVDGDQVVYAKVADFGLSKTKESSSSYSSLTANTGTTRWMAPELFRPGEDDLGARTSDQDSKLRHPFKVDVYSFGLVCYQVLTGKVPFSSIGSLKEVKKMVLKGERPELPERCPESLKRLICSCWDAEASRRPSFEEICRQLRRLKYLLRMCSSSMGNEPGTFEVIRAWGSRVHLGYKKGFKEKYRIGSERATGFGRYSRDVVGIDVMSSRAVAVKCIENIQMEWPEDVEYVKREVNILRYLSGHMNIVDFYGAFQDDDYVYIVTELCEGGSLLDRIKTKGYYPERDAAGLVSLMLKILLEWYAWGLGHSAWGLGHFAVHPEHFLFKSSEEDSTLKATAFGLADYFKPGGRFRDIVPDNVACMAPEVLMGDFTGRKSDMWSIGVITYMLLCGISPFVADTEAGIRVKILENKPGFEEGQWLSITSDAKDFVKKLLVTDKKKRLTAAQALLHPWVKVESDAPQKVVPPNSDSMMHQLDFQREAWPSITSSVLQMLPKGCPEKKEPNVGQHLYKEVASKKLQEPPSSSSVYLNTAPEKEEPNAGQRLYREVASKKLQEPPSSGVYLNTASEKKEPNAGQHLYRRFASKTLQEPPPSSSRVYFNTASKYPPGIDKYFT